MNPTNWVCELEPESAELRFGLAAGSGIRR